MINLCNRCGKVINEGEEIEMMIGGTYRLIPSTKAFALHKDISFKPNTICHTDCGEELIDS